PTPDPNIGKRNAPSTGMVINDEQGFERAGFGLHNVNGQHRVVLGMDSNKGSEALSLAVLDEGWDRNHHQRQATATVTICGYSTSKSAHHRDGGTILRIHG